MEYVRLSTGGLAVRVANAVLRVTAMPVAGGGGGGSGQLSLPLVGVFALAAPVIVTWQPAAAATPPPPTTIKTKSSRATVVT